VPSPPPSPAVSLDRQVSESSTRLGCRCTRCACAGGAAWLLSLAGLMERRPPGCRRCWRRHCRQLRRRWRRAAAGRARRSRCCTICCAAPSCSWMPGRATSVQPTMPCRAQGVCVPKMHHPVQCKDLRASRDPLTIIFYFFDHCSVLGWLSSVWPALYTVKAPRPPILCFYVSWSATHARRSSPWWR
jgi:hypothetical protein